MVCLELVGKRTRHSRTLSNSDGTFTLQSSRDLHYQDEQGAWQPTDLTFTDGALTQNAVMASVDTEANTLTLTDRASGSQVVWGISAGANVRGNRVEVQNGGLFWVYVVTSRGVKLQSEPVPERLGAQTYHMPTSGIDFVCRGDGGLDGPGFVVERPAVQGADGVLYGCSPLRVAGGYISFSVDDTNLPDTAFPYIIDPTTTFSVAANGDDGYVASALSTTYPPTKAQSSDATSNSLTISRSKISNFYYQTSVGLLRFDTSALPADANISAATLKLIVLSKSITDVVFLTGSYYDTANWPIDLTDWTATLEFDAVIGPSFADMAPATVVECPLYNVSGVNLAGYTGFRLHAYTAAAPTGANQVLISTKESGGTPQFDVTYSIPTTYTATPAGSVAPAGTHTGLLVKVGTAKGGDVTPAGTHTGVLIPASSPAAGVTNDILLGEYDFRVDPGSVSRSDITAAIPRIAVATDSKRRSDFSELDTLGQFTWHHGRGQLLFEDVASFMEGEFVDTRVQGQVIPAPARHLEGAFALTVEPVAVLYWPVTDKVYILVRDETDSGNVHLYEKALDATSWTVVSGADTLLQAAGSVPMGMALIALPDATDRTTTDYLVITRNRPGDSVTGLEYIYTSDGSTFTAGLAGIQSKAGNIVGWRERLAYDITNSSIVLRADPATSATTDDVLIVDVGSAAEAMTCLIPLGELLIAIKEGSLFGIQPQTDGSYIVKQLLDYSWGRHADNGKGAYVKDGVLYFNVLQSVYQFSGTSLRGVGPDMGAHEPATALADASGLIQVPAGDATGHGPSYAKRGTMLGMTGSGGWLFGAVEGADVKTVLAYNGTGWHELTQLSTGSAGMMTFLPALSSAGTFGTPTLWYRDGSNLYYLRLPEGTDNRWDYAAADYETTDVPQLTSSWFTADMPEVSKDWLELHLDVDVQDDSTSLTVEFQTDFTDTWYTLGTSYGREPLRFPDNGTTLGALRAKAIRLRISFTNSSTFAPRLKGFFFRFISRPVVRYGWKMQLLAEDHLQKVDRTLEELSGEDIAGRLYELRARPGPLRFDDGRSLSGKHNYLQNPGLEGWYAGQPVNWSLVGVPAVSRDAQWTWQGGYTAKVQTSDVGQGLVSAETESLDAGDVHAVCRLRVLSGSAYVELLKDGVPVVSVVASPTGLDDAWHSAGLPTFIRFALDYTAASAGVYQLRVSGGTGSDVFWLDGCEVREGTDDHSAYIAEGEPRCKPTTPGSFFSTTAYRPPFWLVYVSTITEAFVTPEVRYGADGITPEMYYSTRFQLEVREAF